eukprot:scaffold12693_cov142-Isochrysis_galbana.AAC.11
MAGRTMVNDARAADSWQLIAWPVLISRRKRQRGVGGRSGRRAQGSADSSGAAAAGMQEAAARGR